MHKCALKDRPTAHALVLVSDAGLKAVLTLTPLLDEPLCNDANQTIHPPIHGTPLLEKHGLFPLKDRALTT